MSSSAARTTIRGGSASVRRASSSARRPTAARAFTCRSRTATTSQYAACAFLGPPEHGRLEPLFPCYRQRPAGRLARRVHRWGRLGALHRPGLSEALLEQDSIRRGTYRDLVATFTLHKDGTDFHSHNAWNLVASDDEWTSPILAEVGPDGRSGRLTGTTSSCSTIPRPEGSRPAKAPCMRRPCDKSHGRIYRIVLEDGKAECAAEALHGRSQRTGRGASQR